MFFGADAGVDFHDSSDDIEPTFHEMVATALIFATIADVVLDLDVECLKERVLSIFCFIASVI